MSDWLSTLPPRTQGLAALVVAVGASLVGILVARMLGDQFYPIVFPISGLLAGMGFFQVLTGYARDDIAKRRLPSGAAAMHWVLILVGIVGGLGLNRFLYGSWF